MKYNSIISKIIPPLITVAIMGLIWHLFSVIISSHIFPEPIHVVQTFVKEIQSGQLLEHITISVYRVLLSIFFASVTATPLGTILGMSNRLYSISAPVIYLTYPIPKIVFLPLVLLFLGLGDASKVFLISLILFFQVVLLVRDSVRNVNSELILSIESLGAGKFTMLKEVYFPASLPGLFSALRISTGVAMAVLFFVESFGTQKGLGYYILVDSWGRLAYEELYAGVLAMALVGLTIYYILDASEKYFCKWNNK
jgi:NitT/TauT family transport system permease protein